MKKLLFTCTLIISILMFGICGISFTVQENTNKKLEDTYVNYLSEGINKTQVIHAYHDIRYVQYSLGGIQLKKIDYNRLLNKFQKVIDSYNYYHSLKLEFIPRILNEHYMQIDVQSTNVKILNKPVVFIGQQAHIESINSSVEGIFCWEYSENYGSGKYKIINDTNVTVDGVAYLDDAGEVISSSYEYQQLILVGKKRMLHISTDEVEGWVYPANLQGCR